MPVGMQLVVFDVLCFVVWCGLLPEGSATYMKSAANNIALKASLLCCTSQTRKDWLI
jgi:hypothetical protein